MIWTGIFNAVRGGWTLERLQKAAAETASSSLTSQEWFFAALGMPGVTFALSLMAACIFGLLLALLLARSVFDWWCFLAAVAGRVRKSKRAKRFRKFAQPDGFAIVTRAVIPAFCAVFGALLSFAVLLPAQPSLG